MLLMPHRAPPHLKCRSQPGETLSGPSSELPPAVGETLVHRSCRVGGKELVSNPHIFQILQNSFWKHDGRGWSALSFNNTLNGNKTPGAGKAGQMSQNCPPSLYCMCSCGDYGVLLFVGLILCREVSSVLSLSCHVPARGYVSEPSPAVSTLRRLLCYVVPMAHSG